jgi:hypothetical protein
MKQWALALLLATSGTMLVGCASAPLRVSLGDPKVQPIAKDYVKQLKRWTRRGQILSDFDQALQLDATLRSPEFRAAYAAKYLDMYKVTPDNQEKVRGELLSDGADTYEFHVESTTHDYLLNDLTGSKTVWRVTLVDDQANEVTPSEVSLVRERRRLEAEFYPYADIFSKGWRIRFPRARPDGTPLVGSDTKSLTLRMAGPQGSVDLVWHLQ